MADDSSKTPAAPRLNQNQALALAAVAVLLAIATVALLWLREPEPTRQLQIAPGSGTPSPASMPGNAPAPASRPEVRQYSERQQFERGIHDFLQKADTLSEAERTRTAQALEAEVVRREAARELSASEALLLRMSLIRAMEQDKNVQLQRAQALTQQYQSQSRQRQAAYEIAQQNDPRFRNYKTQEARIVAEVQAMRAIPGGLSRDEYLRLRLQQAREAAYAQPQQVPQTQQAQTPAPAPAATPPKP